MSPRFCAWPASRASSRSAVVVATEGRPYRPRRPGPVAGSYRRRDEEVRCDPAPLASGGAPGWGASC